MRSAQESTSRARASIRRCRAAAAMPRPGAAAAARCQMPPNAMPVRDFAGETPPGCRHRRRSGNPPARTPWRTTDVRRTGHSAACRRSRRTERRGPGTGSRCPVAGVTGCPGAGRASRAAPTPEVATRARRVQACRPARGSPYRAASAHPGHAVRSVPAATPNGRNGRSTDDRPWPARCETCSPRGIARDRCLVARRRPRATRAAARDCGDSPRRDRCRGTRPGRSRVRRRSRARGRCRRQRARPS